MCRGTVQKPDGSSLGFAAARGVDGRVLADGYECWGALALARHSRTTRFEAMQRLAPVPSAGDGSAKPRGLQELTLAAASGSV